MYEILDAVGKSTTDYGHWTHLDVANIETTDLIVKWAQVAINLTNKVTNKTETLFVKDIASELVNFSGNFQDYLNSLGNRALPTSPDKIVLEKNIISHRDAVRAGYKLKPVSMNASPDADLPIEDKTAIYMSKDNIEPAEFEHQALVSVNGFFHRTVSSDQGIWIVDGMKSVLRSGHNHVGVTSFKRVGRLDVIDITPDMIYSDTNLYDRCYVDLGIDTENKTLMLVLGGYLHLFDWLVFRHISEKAIRIDFKSVPLFSRYHESLRYLDVDSLVEDKGYDLAGVSIGELTSDEFLKKYLTMSQSFVVMIDNPEVYKDKINLRTTKLPGQYIAHTRPVLPLVTGHGKLSEYWSIKDDGLWAVNTAENFYHNWLNVTTDVTQENAITDSRVAGERVEFSRGEFLEIGTMIKKVKP